MKTYLPLLALTLFAAIGCTAGKKVSSLLLPEEWVDQNLPTDYSDSYSLKKGDIFVNEDWKEISGEEYLRTYRYYKHKKALYKKGDQQAFKLESAPEKMNRYKKSIEGVDAFFATDATMSPNFELNGRDKRKITLESLKGKVVVFNFWFINCPPCRKEIPELNELVKDYANNKDVVFLAPSLDTWEKLDEFEKKQPFDYQLFDEHEGLSEKFSVPAYPSHVILGKDGKIELLTVGGQVEGIMREIFSKKIDELL